MHNQTFYMTTFLCSFLLLGWSALAMAQPINLLDKNAVIPQIVVAVPLQPWQSSQVASTVTGEKDYCVAATRFSNGTTLVLAVKGAGQTSLAIKSDAPIFNISPNETINFIFPNGNQGRFIGRADTAQSIIVQAGNDDYFWENLTAHDHVNIGVEKTNFSSIYNITDIKDVRKKLLSCDMRVNEILSSNDLMIDADTTSLITEKSDKTPTKMTALKENPKSVNTLTNGIVSRAVLPNAQDDLRLYHYVEKAQRQKIQEKAVTGNASNRLVPDMPSGYVAVNAPARQATDTRHIMTQETTIIKDVVIPNNLPAALNGLLQKTDVIPLHDSVNTMTNDDRHISTWVDNRSISGRFEQTYFMAEQVQKALQSLAKATIQGQRDSCGGDFGFAPSISKIDTIGSLSMIDMNVRCRNINKDSLFTGLFFTNKGTLSALAFEGSADQSMMMQKDITAIKQVLADLDQQDDVQPQAKQIVDYVDVAEQNIENPIFQRPVVQYLTLNNTQRALPTSPVTQANPVTQGTVKPSVEIQPVVATVYRTPEVQAKTYPANSLSSLAEMRSTANQAGRVVSPKPIAHSLPTVLFGGM